MVNRNDAAVPAVFISGRRVVTDGEPTPLVGHERVGQFLRAERPGAPVVSRLGASAPHTSTTVGTSEAIA
jgi:hypothetical protein